MKPSKNGLRIKMDKLVASAALGIAMSSAT